MSRSANIAAAMAARLNALPALSGVETLVDKQKAILPTINLKLAKAGGMVIVIFYQGFDNTSAAASGLVTITRHYLVSVYARPVLQDATEADAESVVETVAVSLHDWEPDETAAEFSQIAVKGCDLRPDNKFLIYDLNFEVLSRL
jgi:hypothetical protein